MLDKCRVELELPDSDEVAGARHLREHIWCELGNALREAGE